VTRVENLEDGDHQEIPRTHQLITQMVVPGDHPDGGPGDDHPDEGHPDDDHQDEGHPDDGPRRAPLERRCLGSLVTRSLCVCLKHLDQQLVHWNSTLLLHLAPEHPQHRVRVPEAGED